MRTIREKAFVILDGTLLPIDRIAADTSYHSGKHKRHGMNVQVLTDPFGRLLWASPALPGSTHDLTAARHHGIIEALAARGSNAGRTRRIKVPADRARTISRPTPQTVEAPPQHHPRQDPLPRRAGHGHPQELAPPAKAPLQHQPESPTW
ncbi:transposase family protein [Streptomyces hydrogenans]|uniref:transposase family protein n=1 Tax=Streptomyces hydrogenans TaxID=1873719 RepID=UPI00365DB483